MIVLTIFLAVVCALMYFEGLLFSTMLTSVMDPERTKVAKIAFLLFWPITVPIAVYALYKRYAPLIAQLRDNPLMESLLTPMEYTKQTSEE